MGKVLEVSKIANMTYKSLIDCFVDEEFLYDNSIKTFLGLFAFK